MFCFKLNQVSFDSTCRFGACCEPLLNTLSVAIKGDPEFKSHEAKDASFPSGRHPASPNDVGCFLLYCTLFRLILFRPVCMLSMLPRRCRPALTDRIVKRPCLSIDCLTPFRGTTCINRRSIRQHPSVHPSRQTKSDTCPTMENEIKAGMLRMFVWINATS